MVSLLPQLLKPASAAQSSTLSGLVVLLSPLSVVSGFPQHQEGGEFIGITLLFLGSLLNQKYPT